MKNLAKKFKALGDQTRLNIFLLLAERKICVKSLAENFEITESAVSQHLKILREAELIVGKKEGYYTHYNVQRKVIKELEGILNKLSNGKVDNMVKLSMVTKNCTSSSCLH
jgi:ArsR family transcriptional regulator